MKTKNFVWQKMLQCIFAMCLVFFVVACDEDDPIQPGNEKTTGEVSFVIDGNNETGSGTTSSPVVVTSGEALDMVITQKSSYTDPDGTVFTCEPEASIQLSATLDKVYAKDIKSLTTINESVDVKTSQSGSNPVLKSTIQTFKIGDQEVVFDLGYEIYNYVNSYSTKIEMPYIKINQAKFGNSSATEKGESTRSACPPIVLRSLSVTRASVTDSATFEVTAKFSLDLETVNTEKKQTKSLNFDVTYLGVVEDVTELYGSVAYKLNDGTGEASSPFVVEGGKELTINIAQTSTYANGDNAVYTAEPKASIKLKVKNKVDAQTNVDSLVTLVDEGNATTSQSGENPLVNLYKRTFATLGQAFDFETSYEVYKSESGDEMPYLKILEPKLVNIVATKQENSTRATGYEDVYYDVVAKFEVEIEGVNVTDELKDVLTFEVKYIGGTKEAVELSGDVDFTVGDGTNDLTSPFVVAGGNEFNLEIKQTSTYANGGKVMYTAEPKATIKFKAKNASNFVQELEALSTLIETEDPTVSQSGENPLVNLYKGSFATLGQSFDFETSYEVYKTENGDEMPYLKFGEPKLVNIEVKQRATTRVIVNDTTYYDVKAQFEVPLSGVNTKEELNKTLSFDVNYTGGVVTSTDVPVELVKTEYRKDMLCHAPHDNISSTSQCVVYRDNYYSDGSVKTDEFYGLRWDFLERSVSITPYGTIVDGKVGKDYVATLDNSLFYKVKYHKTDVGDYGTYTRIASTEIYGEGVPDLSGLSVTWQGALDWTSDYAEKTPPSDLGLYGSEAGDGSMYDASNPVDGFYFYYVYNSVDNFIDYKKNGSWTTLFALDLVLNWYDRFFSIDGEVISFEEYRPVVQDTKNALTYEEVGATSTRGPARVYTLEAKGKYLEKDIHLMLVDTVYVTK